MVPVRRFEFIIRAVNLTRLPMKEGMGPTRELLKTLMEMREVSEKRVEGMEPVKRFAARER
jgi:hypothetical protein